MKASELREKYFSFFKKLDHKLIPPAPLVLENDPTTLFTSSGMQPLVPYLMGEPHHEGKRLVDSQPCIRVQDIEEVGDNRHTTFFEMLGNWSLGDYYKKEQLGWIWKFLTKELGLPSGKLYVSIFEGNKEVAKDEESNNIWRELGVSQNHIFEYGVKKNWWSRSGSPDQMPEGEIGGPSSEIFFEFDSITHDKKFGNTCHPNCDCGRFIEIGNSVFIQYKKTKNGLEELPQKNVDFGGGLERLVAAINNDPDIFKIDIFENVISSIEERSEKSYAEFAPSMRIIADHIRASIFLINSGVTPSNKAQGYVLRRLLRRAALKIKNLFGDLKSKVIFNSIIDEYMDSSIYLNFKNVFEITDTILTEIEKFNKTLDKGLKEFKKIETLDGKAAFDLYQSYGFPLELTLEIFADRGQKINTDEFKKAFAEHQEKSRTASAGVFKGGLADHSNEVTRLHTATHLLQAALRQVLGDHVMQRGSNITVERLRFDFTHTEKLTEDQIRKVEDLINEQIQKDLSVSFEIMLLEDAKKSKALANFSDRYEKQVKVYSIGSFSKEVCGGPHVEHLSQIGGHVRINKQEAVSAGIRRLYATVE